MHMAAGTSHTCCVLTSGAVQCWGSNAEGQLGNGGMDQGVFAPAGTVNLGGAKAVQVAAGKTHTCVLLNTQDVICWGGNTAGQLGYGDFASHLVPLELGP